MGFYNHQLSYSLAKVGWRVFLCTGNSYEYRNKNYQVYNVFDDVYGLDSIIKRAIKYLIGVFYSYGVAILKKASIVHFHFYRVGIKEAFLIAFAKLLKRKVVITAHDVGSFRNKDDIGFALKYVYSSASAIIVHSSTAFSALIELNPTWDSKIALIPHGNFIDYFKNISEFGANLPIPENKDEFRILFFGKLKRIKRVDIIIKALGNLKRNGNSSIRLIIAGELYDIQKEEITKLISDQGLEDNVSLILKYIKDDELKSLFSYSHLSVLPYDLIFQSGVLLLCMSCKVPVIVSNIVGMTDVISDDLNGLVFEAGNHIDLSNKIKYLMERPDALEEITNNAFMKVKNNNSWNLCGELTDKVFSDLISRK